jgi:hypothetical protein
MKLHRASDVVPRPEGLVCRQGRFAGVLMLIVFGGAVTALPVCLYLGQAPKLAWIAASLVPLLLVPLLWSDVKCRLRKSNWLVWVDQRRLWINLRSYQDESAADHPAIVELEYGQIAAAAPYVQVYTTPKSNGGSTQQKLVSIELWLGEPAPAELAAALAECRRREQPTRQFLGIRGRKRLSHCAISLPRPDVIRLLWRGGPGHYVVPSLNCTLAALAAHVPLGEERRDDRPDWKEIPDEQLDERIIELAEMGSRLEAIKLLVSRRGQSHKEARQFVDELLAKA